MIDFGYWEIGQSITRAIIKGLGYAAKGGIWAYNRYKDNELQQEIEEQTAAINQPDLPPTLASYSKQGVIFGKWQGVYLTKPDDFGGHIMVVGGSGSGKTSCIAIPSLRASKARAFVIDITGELYETTKDYRPNIKVFNPLDSNAYGYNPYWSLLGSDNPAQEARAISQAIIPLPHNVRDPFWIESAQNIFTGSILHFSNLGLGFLGTIKVIQSVPARALIQEIAESDISAARYCVNGLLGMDDKTLAGIMAELSRHIVVFITDKHLVSTLKNKNTIHPTDLEYGNDIYIHIPEHLLNQWKPLITMMVNQFLRYFEQRTGNERILFLLDEFPRLGKIEAITSGLATLRSKGITICLIIQSLAQLDEIYGHDTRKVIADNCNYQAILSATDADTQGYYSRLVGTWDKPKKRYGKQLEMLGLIGSRNEGTAFENAPIIKPEEFRQLGNDVIVLTPFGFCRVEKVPYYADE